MGSALWFGCFSFHVSFSQSEARTKLIGIANLTGFSTLWLGTVKSSSLPLYLILAFSVLGFEK